MNVNASTFNTPLEALLDRTAWLKERVDGLVPDVQIFLSSSVWVKPDHAVLVHVQAIGAGGAGGGAVSVGSPAGGGGGSAPLVQRFYLPYTLLGATEDVQVGRNNVATPTNTSGAQGQASIFAVGKDYRLHAIGGNGGIGGHLGSAGGAGFCGGGGGGNNAPGGHGATAVQDAEAGSGSGGDGGESVPLFLRGGALVIANAGYSGAGGATTEGGHGGHGYGAGGGGGGASNGGGGGGGMGWVFGGPAAPTAGDGTGTGDSPARQGGAGAPGIVIVTTWRAVV